MNEKLSNEIIKIIGPTKKNLKINFLCLGTDRVIGDSLGPIIGTKLKEYIKQNNIEDINIIGSLEEPLNSLNYNKVKDIKGYKILIDSAISNEYKIGSIIIEKNSKILKQIINEDKMINSDIVIKYIISEDLKNKNLNFIKLQNIKLSYIYKAANDISKSLINVIKKYN